MLGDLKIMTAIPLVVYIIIYTQCYSNILPDIHVLIIIYCTGLLGFRYGPELKK